MHKRFLYSILLLLGLISGFQSGLASDFHAGDVLVLSDHRRPETYIHVGLISSDAKKSGLTLLEANESEGCVSTDLDQYLASHSDDQTILILRPLEFEESYDAIEIASAINQNFAENMEGHSYNTSMVLDTSSEKGRNYYCSELVMELLNPLLHSKIPTHTMTFEDKIWDTIFRIKGFPVPRGKQGISPSDFVQLKTFKLITKISPKPVLLPTISERRPSVASDYGYGYGVVNRSSRSYSGASNDSIGYSSTSNSFNQNYSGLTEVDSDEEALNEYLGF